MRACLCRMNRRVALWLEVKLWRDRRRKPSLNRARLVSWRRPETMWPTAKQVEGAVRRTGGPDRVRWKVLRWLVGSGEIPNELGIAVSLEIFRASVDIKFLGRAVLGGVIWFHQSDKLRMPMVLVSSQTASY